MTLADVARRAARAGIVAAVAEVGLRSLASPQWTRTNYAGRAVSLAAGPAAVAGVAAGSAAPAVQIAALLAGGLGRYDDAVPDGPADKGLSGHLRAIAAGRRTAGAVKLVGLPLVGVVSAVARPRAPGRRLLLDAGLVAAGANLANLLDLRPGRLLKVAALAAAAVGEAPTSAVCLALLPADLAQLSMLGDCGANALGAALGAAAAGKCSPRGRFVLLAVMTAMTIASERWSFSDVIDATPPLRAFDRLGQRVLP